jgi:site-specific recombinase
LSSGSVFFAALTGVCLWSSSVAGGWCDNWVRYRRLPEALATNRRIRAVIGVNAAKKLASVVDGAGAGAFGSLFLGLVLGLTPVLASFFGLPLDIRHITLSTGTVVMGAMSAFGVGHLDSHALGGALAGLAGIAAMNFGVSFSLALAVALRARDVDARVFRLLVAAVLSRLVRRPMEFVFPRWLKDPKTTSTSD